jgi:poly(3-hydroxyalkanoate) depolymerase
MSMTAEPTGRAAPAAPDRIRNVSVRGLRARVSVRPAQGRLVDEPPLLMCNGLGASFETLQPLVDALDPDRGVVRFDVPGVGGSAAPILPYPIAALSSWVTTMMAKLDHREFDVLGLSWGGVLAQQLAVQSRRRVRRVVLVATGTGWLMLPARPSVVAKLLTPSRHRDPEYAARIAPQLYGGTMRSNPELGAQLLHNATRVGPRRGYFYQLTAMTCWASLPFLRLIRQPTLVMGGDDDPIIRVANLRIQAALIPSATLHLYRGGHLAILTEADELAPVIEQFLGEPSLGEPGLDEQGRRGDRP